MTIWPPPPPPQCDYIPTIPYIIKQVPRGFCGNGACSKPKSNSCIIWIESGYEGFRADLLRHEFGHCNCPEWKD